MITIPVILERCAGIDVGKRELAVAIAVGPVDKEAAIETRMFGTTVPGLQQPVVLMPLTSTPCDCSCVVMTWPRVSDSKIARRLGSASA